MRKILIYLLFLQSFLFSQEFNYLPKVKEGEIIKHTYYTLSFVDKYKQAEWVAYKLTDKMVKGGGERENKFKPDPLVVTGTATEKDYRKTNYDKGHLCPAADMSWKQSAMNETFYFSNISPQQPRFNRGIWKKLEEDVRDWVKKEKTLYIVTGGILHDSLKTIGVNHDISVPEYFYKVILDIEAPEKKGIAFIMKNEESDESVSDFAVTIDSVEALTKIDFFADLPNELENKIEGSIDLAKWGLEKAEIEEVNEPAEKRCQAMTKENTQCKRKAMPGSDYCKQHAKVKQ